MARRKKKVRWKIEMTPDHPLLENYPRRYWNDKQRHQINFGLNKGYDVSLYDDRKFRWEQMRQIRMGIDKGIDVTLYNKREIKWEDMEKIRLELQYRKLVDERINKCQTINQFMHLVNSNINKPDVLDNLTKGFYEDDIYHYDMELEEGTIDINTKILNVTISETNKFLNIFTSKDLSNKIKNLVTKKNNYGDYTNDLTREMDTYLSFKSEYTHTYIYEHSFDNKYWGIRFPGATRGHIEVNSDNIIVGIELYKDCNSHKIYKPEVEECFKKYIGMRFTIE